MPERAERPNPALTVPDAFAAFDQAWRVRYGRPYLGFGPRLGKVAKGLIAFGLTRDEVAAAAARYVADDDPYLTKRRHPFEVFAGGNRINQYLGDAPAPDTFAAASAQFLERLK